MTRHGWNAEHRDALLSRVTLLTAGTAVAGAVGAVALGAGLAAATPVASKSPAPAPSTKPVKPSTAAGSGSSVQGVGGSGQSNAALAPQDISVAVLNGTGVAGAAHAAAGDLRKTGFRISATANYQGRVRQSIIGYPAGMKAAAQLLADSTGVSQIQQADTGGQLVLVVGADWQGSKPVVQAPAPDQGGNGGGNGGGGNGPVSSGGS